MYLERQPISHPSVGPVASFLDVIISASFLSADVCLLAARSALSSVSVTFCASYYKDPVSRMKH